MRILIGRVARRMHRPNFKTKHSSLNGCHVVKDFRDARGCRIRQWVNLFNVLFRYHRCVLTRFGAIVGEMWINFVYYPDCHCSRNMVDSENEDDSWEEFFGKSFFYELLVILSY